MKILVFEYISGGGLATEVLPQSLAREGDLMVRALLDDLLQIEGCRLTVMRDARLEPPRITRGGREPEWVEVGPQNELEQVWKSALRSVDAVWPIAPETGGVLERLCRDVLAHGKHLLSSPPDTVAATAAKLATLRHLESRGIEVVPSVRLCEFHDEFLEPWVVKPNDGVGCSGVRLVRNKKDLQRLIEQPPAESLIIQPFIEGEAMSLSALFKRGEGLLLSCNRQNVIIREGHFCLTGCQVNITPLDHCVFSELTGQVARAFPELFGYAGVDLILVDGIPKILEVNPRLTTSYAVLSRALQRNVAAMVLDLVPSHSALPELRCSDGSSLAITLEENDES
ncbi:MAG: ATP-grasp domain-containing protein [Gammaproteobacteria bacterium]